MFSHYKHCAYRIDCFCTSSFLESLLSVSSGQIIVLSLFEAYAHLQPGRLQREATRRVQAAHLQVWRQCFRGSRPLRSHVQHRVCCRKGTEAVRKYNRGRLAYTDTACSSCSRTFGVIASSLTGYLIQVKAANVKNFLCKWSNFLIVHYYYLLIQTI